MQVKGIEESKGESGIEEAKSSLDNSPTPISKSKRNLDSAITQTEKKRAINSKAKTRRHSSLDDSRLFATKVSFSSPKVQGRSVSENLNSSNDLKSQSSNRKRRLSNKDSLTPISRKNNLDVQSNGKDCSNYSIQNYGNDEDTEGNLISSSRKRKTSERDSLLKGLRIDADLHWLRDGKDHPIYTPLEGCNMNNVTPTEEMNGILAVSWQRDDKHRLVKNVSIVDLTFITTSSRKRSHSSYNGAYSSQTVSENSVDNFTDIGSIDLSSVYIKEEKIPARESKPNRVLLLFWILIVCLILITFLWVSPYD
jgi:hypothetical protein